MNIQKASRARQLPYKRLRKAYEIYIRETIISVHKGDDLDIYELPLYYSEINRIKIR